MSETHKSNALSARIGIISKGPLVGNISTILLGLMSLGSFFAGIYWAANPGGELPSGPLMSILGAIWIALISGLLAFGMWKHKDWARTGLIAVIGLGLAYLFVSLLFDISSQIFAGEHVVSGGEIATILMTGLLHLVKYGGIPAVFSVCPDESKPKFCCKSRAAQSD